MPVNRRHGTWVDRLGLSLYPPRCLLCDQPAEGPEDLCSGCALDRPRIEPACPRCAVPVIPAQEEGRVCPGCHRHPPAWRSARAGGPYVSPVDDLILGLKYGRCAQNAGLLSAWMEDALRERPLPEPGPDAVTAVPLHRLRLMRRGYDQAWMLARTLATRLSLPTIRPLRRSRRTPAQTGLSADQRRRNLAGAFRCRPVPGRRVLLVDDVFTTGATLRAACGALRGAGAASVDVVVAARVED